MNWLHDEANANVKLSRRTMLGGALGGLLAAALPATGRAAQAPQLTVDLDKIEKVAVNGRINQGICGCGLRMPLEQKCAMISKMGIKSVDFSGPADWPTLKKYNLVASLCAGAGSIASGWNR